MFGNFHLNKWGFQSGIPKCLLTIHQVSSRLHLVAKLLSVAFHMVNSTRDVLVVAPRKKPRDYIWLHYTGNLKGIPKKGWAILITYKRAEFVARNIYIYIAQTISSFSLFAWPILNFGSCATYLDSGDSGCWCWWFGVSWLFSLKPSIAPENWWLESGYLLFEVPFFNCELLVSGRGRWFSSIKMLWWCRSGWGCMNPFWLWWKIDFFATCERDDCRRWVSTWRKVGGSCEINVGSTISGWYGD